MSHHPPVAYRTSDSKYIPSFPPPVYYRDTFGLNEDEAAAGSAPASGERGRQRQRSSGSSVGGRPLGRRMTADSLPDISDTDSIATKSTVRTTINIHHNNAIMMDSMLSKGTTLTPSYHIEQLVTSKILSPNARSLLILTLIMFASAIQLLIFSTICVFFDGGPYYSSVIISILLILTTLVILTYTKCCPTRNWLVASFIAAFVSFVGSFALFLWTAFLVNDEDKYVESVGAKENRIVVSTRLALYSFEMIFAPIHAISALICVYLLYNQLRSASTEKISNGYFLSEPQLGHQRILVPIELREVRDTSYDDTENASVGVQTSGTRSEKVV